MGTSIVDKQQKIKKKIPEETRYSARREYNPQGEREKDARFKESGHQSVV